MRLLLAVRIGARIDMPREAARRFGTTAFLRRLLLRGRRLSERCRRNKQTSSHQRGREIFGVHQSPQIGAIGLRPYGCCRFQTQARLVQKSFVLHSPEKI
jgi:hypothetical protein